MAAKAYLGKVCIKIILHFFLFFFDGWCFSYLVLIYLLSALLQRNLAASVQFSVFFIINVCQFSEKKIAIRFFVLLFNGEP